MSLSARPVSRTFASSLGTNSDTRHAALDLETELSTERSEDRGRGASAERVESEEEKGFARGAANAVIGRRYAGAGDVTQVRPSIFLAHGSFI
jgi:hypothetical protein